MGCNGAEVKIPDLYKTFADAANYLPVGSIIVKAGCTYEGFKATPEVDASMIVPYHRVTVLE